MNFFDWDGVTYFNLSFFLLWKMECGLDKVESYGSKYVFENGYLKLSELYNPYKTAYIQYFI